MGKVITIRRDDEHRAKIDKEFLTKEIFADVYRRADILVREITDELKRYDKEMDKKYLPRYQGMGNNIITFCGERGQGKTSAMQSFVKHLTGSGAKAGSEGAESIEFVKSADHYEMIDSIDPSAMENGESVLRVLISRLFFRVDKYIHEIGITLQYDDAFLQNKESIAKLFEKCYQNIDYIKNGRSTDYEQDDLDTLSQLGSSAKLKENLHDLIETYLKMIAGSDCEEKRDRYLVIPIDDADLATKKVFDLCEDIRNYLSIPNVIILMAVDYEQLVLATYQEYLMQFKTMWQAEGQFGQGPYVIEKCHEMAARYLEKAFPVTHRIDLPKIDYMLMEGYEDVRFEYIVPDDKVKGMTKHAFEELYPEDCRNLQDQLLEVLYKRTGLVFAERSRKMHHFLPHTLRELAHWVKMLYDMHEVDCDDLYEQYQGQKPENSCLKEDIGRLKDNILTVKQFFMNYWCEKYLDISDARIFQKIDHATRREQMLEVKNILCGHLKQPVNTTDASYSSVIHEMAETELESEGHFQEAIYIYYTIFLNEWFAAALEDNSQFGRIACFVQRIMDLSVYSNRYVKTYKVAQFPIDMDVLWALLGARTDLSSIDPATQKALESFCVMVKNDKIVESAHIMESVNRKVRPEMDSLWQFDVFRPIIQSLKEFAVPPSDKVSREETRSAFSGSSVLIAVRNIVANCDVQWQVRNAFDSWYEANAARGEFVPLSEQIPNLYDAVGKGIGRPRSRKDKELVKIYENTGAKNNEVMNMLFLCNRDNFTFYVSALSSTLERLGKDISEKPIGESVRSDKQEGYLGNMEALQNEIDDSLRKFSVIKKADLQKCFVVYKRIAGIDWEMIERLYNTLDDKLKELLKKNDPTQEGQAPSAGGDAPAVGQHSSVAGQNDSAAEEDKDSAVADPNVPAVRQDSSAAGQNDSAAEEDKDSAVAESNDSATGQDSSVAGQNDSATGQDPTWTSPNNKMD